MSGKIWLLLLFVIGSGRVMAQDRWDLQRCVLYAVENNISVKQADVQARLSALTLKLSQSGLYPNLNFNTNAGYNFGRSVNPATNQFENNRVFFSGYQLQTNVNLFNWFSQRKQVEADKLNVKAAEALVESARNDVALNVAVAYLQVLLANETMQISAVQVQQTRSLLETTRKRVNAGTLPELNALELEAQLATDSSTYIGSQATYQQNIFLLKALLNLDMGVAFEVTTPDITTIPVESLAELQPAYVYAEALKNLPAQRSNSYSYQAALKNIQVARSAMFPTLSAFANIGSRYSSLFPDQQNVVVTPTGKFDTLGTVQISPGVNSYAVRPAYNVSTSNVAFGRQVFNVNLSQAIGLSLNVPIFNNRLLRTAYDRAKLNAENFKYQLDKTNLDLQSSIYSAYTTALNAQQRYFASSKSVEVAQRVADFSQKRYNAGLLPIIELITNQNNLQRATLQRVADQYEYVFRIKLLEFYKGQGLKL